MNNKAAANLQKLARGPNSTVGTGPVEIQLKGPVIYGS